MISRHSPPTGCLARHYSFGVPRAHGAGWPVIFLGLILSACLPVSVWAAKNDTRLAHVENQIATLERQIDKDRSAHGRAVAALRRAEQSLAEAVHQTEILQSELMTGRQRSAEINHRIREQETALQGNRTILAAQLRARQAMGEDPWLKVFLSPTDPAHAGRLLTYLQYFQQSQIGQIDAARNQLNELARLRADAREEQAKATRLLTEQQAVTETLRQARAERERAVARLTDTLAGRGDALEQLQADRARLETVVADLPLARSAVAVKEPMPATAPMSAFPGGLFSHLKGRLGWPVRGVIKARFGTERQEGRMQWQGLLIGAPEGSQVHAVADGEVLFAAWMPYYGLVGIIDHGGGFLTLYGHNQALFRRAGEHVRAGDVLGRVGASGGRDTPALYFEIRQAGNPVNPERWLSASRE